SCGHCSHRTCIGRVPVREPRSDCDPPSPSCRGRRGARPQWARGPTGMADVGPVAPSGADASFVVSLPERAGPAGAVRERSHMGGHAHNTERGASGVEYVGMIVVAAIVVAAIVLAISPAGADVRAAT